ncbi:MAG: hypothetical protein M3Q10_18795 [Chloroflexota bacterium]|nr:hypothetical protein [Chloroflexota bacterium]
MGGLTGRPSRLLALVPLLVALTLALAACSPEGARLQGQGAGTGGDPDNWDRDAQVELHGEVEQDQRIYHETPNRLPEEQR